jgi:PadR family transcriptional regulator, regulatory protein AphA
VRVPQLSPTARIILGALALGARTGYDVRSLVERATRFFWGASYGQIYPELTRLAEQGLIAREPSAAGGRRRAEYRLSEAGEREFREWLSSREPLLFQFRDEGLLKYFLGDVAPPDEVLANVRQLREENEADLARFRSMLAGAEPELAGSYTLLALEYGIAFLEWNASWWRQVERGLSREARS